MKYVITPRRTAWWIDAIADSGKSRPITSYASEEAAVARLARLHASMEAREMRKAEREASRYWNSGKAKDQGAHK